MNASGKPSARVEGFSDAEALRPRLALSLDTLVLIEAVGATPTAGPIVYRRARAAARLRPSSVRNGDEMGNVWRWSSQAMAGAGTWVS